MRGPAWDGTEGDADRLLAEEMGRAGCVADAGRAMDSWVMRVAIAREKLKEGTMPLRALEILEHAKVHVAKIFLNSTLSGDSSREFAAAIAILDQATERFEIDEAIQLEGFNHLRSFC